MSARDMSPLAQFQVLYSDVSVKKVTESGVLQGHQDAVYVCTVGPHSDVLASASKAAAALVVCMCSLYVP